MIQSLSPKVRIALFCLIVSVSIIGFLSIFLNRSEIRLPETREKVENRSFTFFDVGESTVLTHEKRGQLKGILGPDRLEAWRPVRIDFISPEWLQKRFSQAGEMDEFLADPGYREFTGKKTIALTYRYPAQQDLPFTKIRFVFSGYEKTPLFVTMTAPGDGADILRGIAEKYGDPQMIEENGGFGPTRFWQKERDLFVVATIGDRYQKPETRILLFYGENADRFRQQVVSDLPPEKVKTGF